MDPEPPVWLRGCEERTKDPTRKGTSVPSQHSLVSPEQQQHWAVHKGFLNATETVDSEMAWSHQNNGAAAVTREVVSGDQRSLCLRANNRCDTLPIDSDGNSLVVSDNQKQKDRSDNDETEGDHLVSIPDDVYNMFFLSRIGGQAFFYAAYTFALKMALFTVLALDSVAEPIPENVDTKVKVAQFLMLPVAVAMQDDLTTTYFLVANIKFSSKLQQNSPHANKYKYHIANLCRGLDGIYSLFINFVILMHAEKVTSLFLNFAALQFLQTIDNIALELAEKGYLTGRLETVALQVKQAKLPRKSNRIVTMLDSVFFLSTLITLVVSWAYLKFAV